MTGKLLATTYYYWTRASPIIVMTDDSNDRPVCGNVVATTWPDSNRDYSSAWPGQPWLWHWLLLLCEDGLTRLDINDRIIVMWLVTVWNDYLTYLAIVATSYLDWNDQYYYILSVVKKMTDWRDWLVVFW